MNSFGKYLTIPVVERFYFYCQAKMTRTLDENEFEKLKRKKILAARTIVHKCDEEIISLGNSNSSDDKRKELETKKEFFKSQIWAFLGSLVFQKLRLQNW